MKKGICGFGLRESLRESRDLLCLWLCFPCFSLPHSFQVLLTLDDDLDVVRRDQIPVFWAFSIKEEKGKDRLILVLFPEKYRDCRNVTTAKCSTHPPWSQLCIHSHREERRRGRFKPARREAERKPRPWTEASPEESRNTHPLMLQLWARRGQMLHQSQLVILGPLPPSPGIASNGRTMLHSSLQLPPCPERPTVQISHPEILGGPPLHLCNICCSIHPKAPAHFSRIQGWRGSSESGREVDPTGIDVLVAPASHLGRSAVYSPPPTPHPRFLTPLERIQIGSCRTHILLTGNCLWNRGLGAYLLLSIFISPLCLPCNAGFTFLRRPCSSTDRVQGGRENGKTFPAAVAARGMADSTKTLVTSESSEQASLSGLGQKCFLVPPIQTAQFCVHITFGEEICV